jgi:TonB family protein
MNRFSIFLGLSIALHIAVIVPLQLMARHGDFPVFQTIKVSLVDKPAKNKLPEIKHLQLTPEPTTEESEPQAELITMATAQEKNETVPSDGISYEKGIKVDPSYHGKLKARIFNLYSYPREAVEEGIQGTSIISFKIEASGKISSLSVKKSSGYEILDKASLNAVSKASPFLSPEKPIKIDATFQYVID